MITIMKNLIKNNIILAKKFNDTRYIDDLLTLNNNQFDAAMKDIYPQKLQLKKTTVCHSTVIFRCTCTYNDRQWEIFNCGFLTKGTVSHSTS